MGDTCVNRLEVFPLSIQCQANLSIGEKAICPFDDYWVEVEVLHRIQKALFGDMVTGTLNIKQEDGKYLFIVVGWGDVV